tara:strand:+ start:256 stop:711 length:456 start_codon:yes stop_codon:yes gene_type:complete
MTRLKKIIGGLAMAATVAVTPMVAHADDQDTIDYRKHVMATLGAQAAALFMTLQQKAPAENFAHHVKALAVTSTQALKAFEPNVEGGTAKGDALPKVWSNWDDFASKMNELVAKLEALDKAAETGGMAAAGPLVQESFTCKGCHDEYRHAG